MRASATESTTPAWSNTNTPPTAFEEDVNEHPDQHFLSPSLDDYNYWSEDSDDDDEIDDTPWGPGFVDFALFASDKKRAEESNEPMPEKWNAFIASQAERSGESSQSEKSASKNEFLGHDLPDLTPDNSPRLNDDLDPDDESMYENIYHGEPADLADLAPYTVIVTPPQTPSHLIEDFELGVPLAVYAQRAKQRAMQTSRKVERPGLRHARTLSGKPHAWWPPGRDMHTVREEED